MNQSNYMAVQYTAVSNVYSETTNENLLLNLADDNSNNNNSNNISTSTVPQPSLLGVQNVNSKQLAINIVYIIVAVFGVLGNTLSLVIICIHPPIRKRLPNYYFINKSIADLLVSVLLIPSVTTGLIPYGYSNQVLCIVWQSRAIFVGLYGVSVYSIVALSVERYLEVVHPMWHKRNVTKVKVIATLAAVWVMLLAYKYAYLAPVTRAVNGVCNIAIYFPNNIANTVGGLMYFGVDFLFPLILIIFFYVQMWRGLRKKVVPHPGFTTTPMYGQPAQKSISTRARRNIVVTLIVIVVCFVVCNTHKQVLLMLKTLNIQPVDNTSVNFNISQILSFMNATIEPYVYLLYHREFKNGFRKLFRRGKARESSYNSQIQPSTATA